MKIITLGPEGTFSHQAALTIEGAELLFANSIEDVFDLFGKNLAEYALVPLENSVSGTVSITVDRLMDCEATILQEILLSIHHHFVSFVNLSQVEKIYAHPHTFGQCRENLKELFAHKKNFEEIEVFYTHSNARSALELLQNKAEGGAIISQFLVDKHEIPILKEDLQDEKNNSTRFILLGHKTTLPTGRDRSSIIFFPRENRRGILSEILLIFSKYHLNLTKIESRPTRKELGQYFFYIDFEGHIGDNSVQKALEEVEKISPYHFLGSYCRQF